MLSSASPSPSGLARTAAAALVALAVAVTGPAAGAAPVTTTGMYDKRYCEYLVIRSAPAGLTADVWNTFGLNRCPAKQWKASNPKAIATSLGAIATVLNGPRHWLMDRNRITLAPGLGDVRSFEDGGLAMRRIASVKVPVANGVPAQVPYAENAVSRRNTFTWSRKHRVYELVSPAGDVFVMQTYAQIVDPRLSVPRLRTLGDRLKLPEGWRYRSRRLTRDLALTTTGTATVIQDDQQNTYQLRRRGG